MTYIGIAWIIVDGVLVTDVIHKYISLQDVELPIIIILTFNILIYPTSSFLISLTELTSASTRNTEGCTLPQPGRDFSSNTLPCETRRRLGLWLIQTLCIADIVRASLQV